MIDKAVRRDKSLVRLQVYIWICTVRGVDVGGTSLRHVLRHRRCGVINECSKPVRPMSGCQHDLSPRCPVPHILQVLVEEAIHRHVFAKTNPTDKETVSRSVKGIC